MGAFDDLIPQPRASGQAMPQGHSAPMGAPNRPTAFDDLVPQRANPSNPFTNTSNVNDPHDAGDQATAKAMETYLSKAMHSIPLVGGMIDPTMAAVDATVSPYTDKLLSGTDQNNANFDVGGLPTWGQRYQASLAASHGRNVQGATDHPLAAQLGGIAGPTATMLSLAPFLSPATSMLTKAAPAAGIVPTMAANGVDGGLVGGGLGYLNGTGSLTDPSRVQGAKRGGEFGALTGAALAPAGALAKTAWKVTGSKLADALMGHVNVGGSAPEIAGVPPPVNPADSMSGPSFAGTPPPTPGPPPSPPITAPPSAVNGAYDRVFQALDRGGTTPEQAFSQVGKLGPQGMLADTNVPVQDFARTVADAPGQGGQIAADALNVRQEGLRQNGQYSAPSSSQRIGDTLAQALQVQGPPLDDQVAALVKQQQTQAAPLYAKAYTAAPVPVSAFQDFSSSPRFQNAYDAARKISQSEFVPQADGSMKLQPLPPTMPRQLDWRTLDLMKQAMDDEYRVSKSPLSGIAANGQRAVLSYNKQFLSTLDSLNPDYAPARAAFSGPANAMDAAEAGRAYVGENPANASTTMADLDPGDRQMFQAGAAQGMKDKLGANTTANAARAAGLYSPNMVPGKMQPLFGDNQAGYANYANTLENENAMFGTRARVMGGSQTSRNIAQEQDAGLDPLDIARQVAEFHVDPASGMLGLMSKLLTAGNGQSMSEPVANSAAKILFDQNNGAYPEYLSGLSAAAKRAALAKLLAGSRGAIGGYAGNIESQNNPSPSAP